MGRGEGLSLFFFPIIHRALPFFPFPQPPDARHEKAYAEYICTPIQYVTVPSKDKCGAASLRYRNCADIAVLIAATKFTCLQSTQYAILSNKFCWL